MASGVAVRLGVVIADERLLLREAYSLVRCLYQALLETDGDAVVYADVAKVAARILDESITRLDPVSLAKAVAALG